MAETKNPAEKNPADKAPERGSVAARAATDAADQQDKDVKASVTPVSGGVDMNRLGESSDPDVHKLLAELGALQKNREELVRPVNEAAVEALDAKIEAVYHRLRTLNDPKYIELRAERQQAAAAGDPKKVAELDAKLDGK